ncbi:hypothetical protein KAU11_12585, partial [Candidatus Babeliales bacterium]|nr:hypothetical protein [Candidatus Babeliales bacterium]
TSSELPTKVALDVYDHSDGATISSENSTSTPLGSGATFTGTSIDATEYVTALIQIYADQDSATDGLKIQSSTDDVNWDHSHDYNYEANKGLHYEASIPGRYFRIVFVNGAVAQTKFRMQVKLLKGPAQDHIHPIEKVIDGGHPAKITRSILTGKYEQDNTYHNISAKLIPNTGEYALNSIMNLASGLGDAFGRLRTAEPLTLFDSKQIFDNQPLFWDDSETSGTGTTSTHNPDEAATTLSVSAATAGTRVRQTFQRFNYQPGKSLFVAMTARMTTPENGLNVKIGYFDDNNGLFFEMNDLNMSVVRRTNVTGTPVNVPVLQSAWNMDPMDGTGPSKITIDPTKTQILFVDMEWLGVGTARMGFFVDGIAYYCHAFHNANSLDQVYMSTPNLPIRYEITNDGTSGAASIKQICSTVISEGGQQKTGVLRHKDSGLISGLSTGTVYALIGIRLKSGYIGMNALIENISAIATSQNDKCHWELRFNPTVAGTFTYADETNSGIQVAAGASSNTVT